MPAHVLDELQDARALRILRAQRATMDRAGHLVDRFVTPHQVHDTVQRGFAEAHVRIQADGIDVGHQVAEHSSLAAAGGDGAVRQAIGKGSSRARRRP